MCTQASSFSVLVSRRGNWHIRELFVIVCSTSCFLNAEGGRDTETERERERAPPCFFFSLGAMCLWGETLLPTSGEYVEMIYFLDSF